MVAAVEVVAAEVAAGTAVAAMAVVGTVAAEAVTVGKVLFASCPPHPLLRLSRMCFSGSLLLTSYV